MPNSLAAYPGKAPDLSLWLKEGVDAEIEHLKGLKPRQEYVLRDGERLPGSAETEDDAEQDLTLYRFTLPDDKPVRDDSPGLVSIEGQSAQWSASVAWQEGTELVLQVRGELPPIMQSALFVVDDLALLMTLSDELEKASTKGPHRLAELLFRPEAGRKPVAAPLPNGSAFGSITREQRRAIETALGCEVCYLWGPPGTGKTFTIARTILAHLSLGRRVLLVSHTNSAVDGALAALLNADASSEHQCLRIGHPGTGERLPLSVLLEKQVRMQLRAMGKSRPTGQKLLRLVAALRGDKIRRAKAVFTTLTRCYCNNDLANEEFDVVIVDELSMAPPPMVFLAAMKADLKVTLVGDFLQLPPIAQSQLPVVQDRLCTDLFKMTGQRWRYAEKDRHYFWLAALRTQARMHPAIAGAARHLLYNRYGGLYDAPSTVHRAPETSFNGDKRVFFIESPGEACKSAGSYQNEVSAELCLKLAQQLAPDRDGLVSIITPFAAQRRLLDHKVRALGIKHVRTGTIHTFQGKESSTVILDLVLAEPVRFARLVGALDEEILRDLNVAVTRSRDNLVVVGSETWLDRYAGLDTSLGVLWDYLRHCACRLTL